MNNSENNRSDAPSPRARIFSFLWKAAVSVGFLALLASQTDIGLIGERMSTVGRSAIAWALVLIVVQTVVTGYRWAVIMGAVGSPVGILPATQSVFVSLFLNQCFPSYIGGDAYRIYWLYGEGTPLAHAVRGVLVDRITALIALVAMLGAGIALLFARIDDATIRVALAVLLVAGSGGTVVLLACDRLPKSWRRWRPVAELAELAVVCRHALFRGRIAAEVGPLAILVHALTGAILWVFARDMGLPLTLADCVLITPPVVLLSAVPISIGGWGVRESVVAGLLASFAVPSEAAIALSLLLGLTMLANGLLGLIPIAIGWDRFVAVRRRAEAGDMANAGQ